MVNERGEDSLKRDLTMRRLGGLFPCMRSLGEGKTSSVLQDLSQTIPPAAAVQGLEVLAAKPPTAAVHMLLASVFALHSAVIAQASPPPVVRDGRSAISTSGTSITCLRCRWTGGTLLVLWLVLFSVDKGPLLGKDLLLMDHETQLSMMANRLSTPR